MITVCSCDDVHIDCNFNLLYHLVALFCLWNVPSFNDLCPSSCYPPVCKAVIHLEEVVHCSRNLGPLCFLKLVTCRKVQILSTWISQTSQTIHLALFPSLWMLEPSAKFMSWINSTVMLLRALSDLWENIEWNCVELSVWAIVCTTKEHWNDVSPTFILALNYAKLWFQCFCSEK